MDKENYGLYYIERAMWISLSGFGVVCGHRSTLKHCEKMLQYFSSLGVECEIATHSDDCNVGFLGYCCVPTKKKNIVSDKEVAYLIKVLEL